MTKIQKYKDLQDIELEAIYAFIDSKETKMPQELADYLDIMDKVRGMHLRLDRYGSKDAIVNHLIKVEKLSRYLANKVYNQSMEYFYADNEISKEAWRNIIAQKMEKNIAIAQMLIKDVNDASKVNKMYKELSEVLDLQTKDEEPLPDAVYAKPNKMYTLNMEDLGKKPQSKKELAEFIRTLPEIPEKVKEMALQEALLKPIEIFPEENEDPRKS